MILTPLYLFHAEGYMYKLFAILCLCCVTNPLFSFQSSKANASDDWKGSLFVAGRWNPMGLSLESNFGPKFELYPSESELLKLNFIKPYFFFGVSPARLHSGVGVEFQPLSIFGVKAFAGQAATFGTYGHLQIFSNSHPSWDDKTRKEKADTPEQQNSLRKIADWYVAQAYLQAKEIGRAHV